MPDETPRVRIRCSNCDYVIVTVSPDYRFEDDKLICPNCGAEADVPKGRPIGDSLPKR